MNDDYLNIAAEFFPIEDDAGEPSFREYQQETVARILSAYDSGKKLVILESPTGSGKSVIAMTVARYFGDAYFITPQKILQDQYYNDFESFGLRSIKGRRNYVCDEFPDISAAEAPCIAGRMSCGFCTYRDTKEKAVEAEYTVFNPYYYLLETSGIGSLFKKRELIVADEAHRLESILMSHYSLALSPKLLDIAGLVMEIPAFGENLAEWVPWLSELAAKASLELEQLERDMVKIEWRKDLKTLSKLLPKLNQLKDIVSKLEVILEDPNDKLWVIDRRGQKSFGSNWLGGDSVEFKPVVVDRFGQLIFEKGKRVLMMSATILDPGIICRALGINAKQVEYLTVPSTFPVKNRRIYVDTVGSMSYQNIQATLPKLARKIEGILEQFPDDKGIVHCTSYKIQQYLIDNVDDSDRFLAHSRRDREQTLEKHISSSEPTVLLSPSMTEGLDLADNASRFQVLCKVPYPPLNDPQVKARMNSDPDWYQLQTALSIVQAYGRSVRSPDDYATTFILDYNFFQFYRRNKQRLPRWFREALIKVEEVG